MRKKKIWTSSSFPPWGRRRNSNGGHSVPYRDKVVRHSPKPVLLVKSASRDLLRGRTVLAVDDEADVLEVIEEVLDMCIIDKAPDHETAGEMP